MGFTVRFMLGTILLLLCFWTLQTTPLSRNPRQATTNGSPTTVNPKNEENKTQSIVANLSEESTKPKTDFSTEENKTLDKQNSIVKLQKSESYRKAVQEVARSIDIEKYVSKEFHNKNNVYTLTVSPDTQKYIESEYDFHGTTRKHEFADFDFHSDLTTPKSSIFDHKFKEAVESVDQELEHIDDVSHETAESESTEDINLEKLYGETKKNDTRADLNYINYKNIISNDTGSKNSAHKDLVVEAGTNLDFRSSFNHTTVIDEDDNGNNTIVKEEEKKAESSTLSNLIPVKGDLDHAESATSKSVVTTRKSITLTKPPSNSHISILSNKIESETVKAISHVQISTEKTKGEMEVVSEVLPQRTIEIEKRPFTFTDAPRTEPTVDTNHINKKSEQLQQENQVIPVHVEPPQSMENATEDKKESSTPKTQEADISTTLAPKKVEETEIPPTTEPERKEDEETSTTEASVIQILTTEKIPTTTLTATTIEPLTTTDAESTTQNIETTENVETENLATTQDPETTTAEAEKVTTTNEFETVTSIVTETSVSPWEKVTVETPRTEASKTETQEIETTTLTTEKSTEDVTTSASTYQADSTVSTGVDEAVTTESAEPIITTEIPKNSLTTEDTVRTSKEMTYKVTTPSAVSTEAATTVEISTVPQIVTTESTVETTTQIKRETTSAGLNYSVRAFPDVKPTEIPLEENTTDNNTITSDFYEHTDPPEDNSGTIAAITISSIGAVCLILVAGLLVIMRKRQKRFNYGQRCTPVSLDHYNVDNASAYNSVRRKGMLRGSKRSYGNPAFEDPVCLTHPLNFPALGKFANNLEDIKAEFEEVPQITTRTNELPEGCDTKNRYANVIPLPETRVFLNLIDGYPNSDYINANFVTGPKNTKGYYIACQAPLQITVDDFWRMIWEQQCRVILMLTHLFENGVEKCIDYLPPSEVLDCHRLFGDFQVTLKKREVKDKYIISSLQLKNMVSNSWREVTHFWYLGWPEKGVPIEANSLIAFLIEARSYMKSVSLDRKEGTNGNLTNGMTKNEQNPVVVHCSPGTGRTGVVIACDIAIREFEQSRLVDVPRIVYKIRRDRASAVQTKEQYAFIYKVINLYATKLTGGALDSL